MMKFVAHRIYSQFGTKIIITDFELVVAVLHFLWSRLDICFKNTFEKKFADYFNCSMCMVPWLVSSDISVAGQDLKAYVAAFEDDDPTYKFGN